MGKILDYKPAIEAYISGLSLIESAEMHHVDPHTLSKKLSAQGVEIRSKYSYWTRYLNHDAFENLTDEASYWIGMLMADGCIYRQEKQAPEIRLELTSRDREHLKRFKKFLSADQPIRTRNLKLRSGNVATYDLMLVRSEQIASRLESFGVFPQKTQRTQIMHLEHNRHFWRGIMDGDGCLTWANKFPALSLVGTRTLMQQFCDHISQAINIHTVPRDFNRGVWTVSLYCRKACALTEYLYSNQTIALERKQTRAEAFATFYP